MKQYVHPILGRTITRHPRSFLGKEYYSVSSKLLDISVSISEEELLALGFIEKEEEPDTDTKWIDDLYESIVGLFSKQLTEEEERPLFKERLLRHIPSRTS